MDDLETGDMQEIATADAADSQDTVEESSPTEDIVEEPVQESTEEVEPKAETTAPKEKVVPFAALQDERRKRQENDRAIAEKNGRIEALEKMVERFGQPQVQENQIDPNEPITMGQVQEILRQQKEQVELETRKSLIQKSVSDVRAKYANEEFSYDDALEWANKNLPQGTGGYIAMVDDNPAQTLYDLVLTKNPDLRKKQNEAVQKDAVNKTVQAINRHTNAPRTLSNATGTDKTLDNIKAIETMSRDDFEALVQKNIHTSN
jgi:hypothetical protein